MNDQIKKSQIKAELLSLLIKIIMLVLIFWVLLVGVFGIFRVKDYAMTPSCKDGDLVLFDRMRKQYQEGDLVVCSVNGEDQIRRIAAVPGDQVEITEEGLFINGYLQLEKEITTETLPLENRVSYPLKLKEQEYFVLADQRDSAKDSRWYGSVRKEEIKGSVILLLRRRGF